MIEANSLIQKIVIAEFSLVGVIVVLTFLFKIISYLKSLNFIFIENEIKRYLSDLIASHVPFNPHLFRDRWKRLDILMDVINKMDKNHNNEFYETQKNTLIIEIMLPIARMKALSTRFSHRFLAVQCFSLMMLEQDEALVCQLIQDKTSIIHLYATEAAIKHSSPFTVNEAINSIASQRRLGKTIYLQAFKNAPLKIIDIIASRIKIERDLYILATCYRILTLFPDYPYDINTDSDLHSENIDLQLAAIRFVSTTKKKQSVPMLCSMLKSPRWETRAVSCKLLGNLKARVANKQLTLCLRDPVWWVRQNAAHALEQFSYKRLKGKSFQ